MKVKMKTQYASSRASFKIGEIIDSEIHPVDEDEMVALVDADYAVIVENKPIESNEVEAETDKTEETEEKAKPLKRSRKVKKR